MTRGCSTLLRKAVKRELMAIINGNDLRYEQRFAASREAIAAAMAAADRAVLKAEAAADKRFEGVSEFRDTLAAQQRTLMPRAETEALLKHLLERIETHEIKISEISSHRGGVSQGWTYALGAAGLVATIFSIIALIK